jgi:aminoglycoside 3-N-acetyltransferase
MRVTKEQIKESIAHYGVRRGDVLALHSSLSAMGEVVNGADTVVDAFLETLGDRGTLIIPTFTYSLKIWGDRYPAFHVQSSPSVCGAITECARSRADAVRSSHPTHSVAALGFFSREMIKDHAKCSPLGKGSPYHKLSQIGGFIVLMGVGQESNALLHTCECLAKVPYLSISYSNLKTGTELARVMDDTGSIVEVSVGELPGCTHGFKKAEIPLRTRGVIQYGQLGNATMQVMKAENVVDIMLEKLEDDPFFLLCDDSNCKICVRRRKYGKKNVVKPKKRSAMVQGA